MFLVLLLVLLFVLLVLLLVLLFVLLVLLQNEQELAEDLLSFFVDEGDKECFAATLYTCSTLVRPDVVMEVAWRNGLMDFAFPYLIQYVRNASDLLAVVDERTKPAPIEETPEGTGDFMQQPGMLALGDGSVGGMGMGGGMGMQQQMGGAMGMQQPMGGGMGMQQPMGGGMGMQQPMGGGMGMQQPMGGMGGMGGMQQNTMGFN